MTKSTKVMREFTAKLKKLNLGDKKEATTIRDMQIQNLEGYADMVDQEWEILRLKVEQMKSMSEHTPLVTAKTAYDNVLKIIQSMENW